MQWFIWRMRGHFVGGGTHRTDFRMGASVAEYFRRCGDIARFTGSFLKYLNNYVISVRTGRISFSKPARDGIYVRAAPGFKNLEMMNAKNAVRRMWAWYRQRKRRFEDVSFRFGSRRVAAFRSVMELVFRRDRNGGVNMVDVTGVGLADKESAQRGPLRGCTVSVPGVVCRAVR